MSNKIMHPTLTLLGAALETSDGDFVDMADVHTILGHVGFSRSSGGRWGWNLVTVMREADDFDDVVGGNGSSPTLEKAVADAERTLWPLTGSVRAGREAASTRGICFAVSTFVRLTEGSDVERARETLRICGVHRADVERAVTVDKSLLLKIFDDLDDQKKDT